MCQQLVHHFHCIITTQSPPTFQECFKVIKAEINSSFITFLMNQQHSETHIEIDTLHPMSISISKYNDVKINYTQSDISSRIVTLSCASTLKGNNIINSGLSSQT